MNTEDLDLIMAFVAIGRSTPEEIVEETHYYLTEFIAKRDAFCQTYGYAPPDMELVGLYGEYIARLDDYPLDAIARAKRVLARKVERY